MMFTEKAMKAAEEKFSRLLEKAGEKKREEILSRLAQAEKTESADVIAAIKWIYANSPLSDLANYDFEIFQSCAEHGVFLRENSPFAKDLPEDIFLNYVLHHRPDYHLRRCRIMDKNFDWSGIPPKVREILESRVGAAVPDAAAAPTQQ